MILKDSYKTAFSAFDALPCDPETAEDFAGYVRLTLALCDQFPAQYTNATGIIENGQVPQYLQMLGIEKACQNGQHSYDAGPYKMFQYLANLAFSAYAAEDNIVQQRPENTPTHTNAFRVHFKKRMKNQGLTIDLPNTQPKI